VVGLVGWQADLTSDAPMHFAGIGQSLSTDPAMYSYHARNRILFGSADPLNDPRWIVFEHSLVSLSSFVWMSLTGISMATANVAGLVLTCLGLMFFLIGLFRHHRPWTLTAVAFCYLINVTLFTYGRLGYLENGLLLVTGILFWVYSWWGARTWGLALCGGLIAVAALSGKLFGTLLLPAVVLSVWATGGKQRVKHIAAATAACLGTLSGLVFTLYGTRVTDAFSFFGEQSVGVHGFPEGLTSPMGFVEHLISFGQRNDLYYLNPDLLILLVVGLALITYLISTRTRSLRDFSRPMLLSLFGAVCLILGVVPLNYSPLRYVVPAIPLLMIFGLTAIDTVMGVGKPAPFRPSRMVLIVAAFSGWLLTYHGAMNFLIPESPYKLVVWMTLPGGLAVAALTWYFLRQHRIVIHRRLVVTILIAVTTASVVTNTFRIRRTHILDHCFTLLEASRDIANVVGPDAVLSGPYAAALCVENDLKSVIHFFGAASADSDFFQTYPITHIAVEQDGWNQAVELFPRLAGLQPIASYWIRDYKVNIYNVRNTFGNQATQSYHYTPYEVAVKYNLKRQYDSALAAIQPVVSRVRTSKAVGLLYAEILARGGALNETSGVLTSLARQFPTDFSVQLACGHFLQRLALTRQNPELLREAEVYFAKAVQRNRFRARYARRLWEENMRQYSQELSPRLPDEDPPEFTIAFEQ